MARWRRITLYAVLGSLAVTLAVVIVLVTVGPTLGRALAEDYVGKATGRAFSIGRDVEVGWGRHLSLVARDVRLANPEWADEPDMLTIGRLDVVLDLFSLLSGPVYLERLEVRELVLDLRSREDGSANWVFPQAGPPRQARVGDDDGTPPLVVGHVDGSDLRIHLSGPNLDRTMELVVRRLSQDIEARETVMLELDGTINDQPLAIAAQLDPVSGLLTGREIDYDLEASVAQNVLRAKGRIDDLRAPRRPTAELSLEGPDIGTLTERLGLGRASEGPFKLTAEIGPEDDVLALRSRGTIGRITIGVEGSVRDVPALDGVELIAEAAGPAIGRVLRVFGLQGPDDPFELRTKISRHGPEFTIEDTRFRVDEARLDLSAQLDRFPTLDDARIHFHAQGPDIEKVRALMQLPGLASGPFDVEGRVAAQPDGTETLSLNGRTNLGRFRIEGRLGDPDTHVGASLDVHAQGERLAALGEALDWPNFPDSPFALEGRIEVVQPHRAELRATTLTVGSHRAEAEGSLTLKAPPAGTDLTLRASGDDLAAVLAMTGVTQGIPAEAYEARGQLRLVEGALELGRIQGRVGSAEVTGSGRVEFRPGVVGSRFDVRGSGPDLHVALAPEVARRYAPAEAFEVRARIDVTDAGIAFGDVSGTLAGASIEGEGLIGMREGLVGSRMTISASGPDLSRVAPELPGFSPPAGPFKLSGRLERGEDFLALEQVHLDYGGATGRIEVRIATLPDRGTTTFDIDLGGPDATVLPIATRFKPDAVPFALEARGEWREDRWWIDDSQLQLADARATVSGELTGLPDSPGGQIEFRAAAPSLAALGSLGSERLPDLALDITATLVGQDGHLELSIPSARVGGTDLSGQVGFRPGDVPRLDVELRSTRLNVRELRGGDAPPAEAPEPKSPRTPGARVIPDTPLPLEALRRLDATMTYAADELLLVNGSARDIRLRATLLDGALRVEELSLSGEVGSLEGTFELVPNGPAADLALQAAATDLRTVFVTGLRDSPALPLFSAEIDLRGRGETWSGLAADLDGRGWLTSKDGQVPNNQLSGLLVGDFVTEVFTTINPFAKTEPVTRIECVAMPFTVDGGKISTVPAWAMRTGRLDIAAWGAVDLATEQIEFNFKTQPRKGLGISASQMINPFMKVVGTMNDPQLTLDPSGTLVTGTATFITGGTWLLFKGVFDSLLREKDPCGKAMKDYRKSLEKASP